MKFDTIPGTNPFGNQQKLLWHMRKLCEFCGTGSTFPIQVELNPTNSCNMNCRWCLCQGEHKKESLPNGILTQFLHDFAMFGGKSIDWTGGGEPTLYTYFSPAIEFAADHGLKQGLMTNGSFSPSIIPMLVKHFSWVRFSLDCVDAGAYSWAKQCHENLLDVVLNNISNLCTYKKRPRVVANVNLAQWNFEHLGATIETTKFLGADGVQIRPVLPRVGMPYSEDELFFYQRMIDELPAFKSYESNKFQVIISWDKFYDIITNDFSRPYDACRFHNFIITLNANGDVCVCTHHLNEPEFVMGNLNTHTLFGIWGSVERQRVVEHCNHLDFTKCQVCCKGHELNKLLHFITHRNEGSDPDFF
jgi:MoaA/NifB/PqqE/SkfB family radical SAM enzyme